VVSSGAGYVSNRLCLRDANAGVDCVGAYPQVLSLSAYWQLDTEYPSTADPPHMTTHSERVSYAYSRHLYVVPQHTSYGDGAGNTVEENSSVFSLIRMH